MSEIPKAKLFIIAMPRRIYILSNFLQQVKTWRTNSYYSITDVFPNPLIGLLNDLNKEIRKFYSLSPILFKSIKSDVPANDYTNLSRSMSSLTSMYESYYLGPLFPSRFIISSAYDTFFASDLPVFTKPDSFLNLPVSCKLLPCVPVNPIVLFFIVL